MSDACAGQDRTALGAVERAGSFEKESSGRRDDLECIQFTINHCRDRPPTTDRRPCRLLIDVPNSGT